MQTQEFTFFAAIPLFPPNFTPLMHFSRAEGAENAERKSGLCAAPHCQRVTFTGVKRAFCRFSAIFAPLREPVFASSGLKDEEKPKHSSD